MDANMMRPHIIPQVAPVEDADTPTMTYEHFAKIEAAATRCLELCDRSPLPFTTVAQFVERLKADSTWTDREIIEMQMRVISVLLNERGLR